MIHLAVAAALAGLLQPLATDAQVSANTLSAEEAPTSPSMVVMLTQPRQQPMEDGEIRAALTGQMMRLDFDPIAPGLELDMIVSACYDPGERFHASGNWEGSRCARVPYPIRGTWKASGSRICVQAEGEKESCRSIWRTANANRFILAERLGSQVVFRLYKSQPLDQR